MIFPKHFIFGAAAASYQVEGAATADGKGPSVWDMMCRWPDKVWEGNTGDVACDHYHRYKEDVGIMRRMGLQAYRLSVSWPRVMPDGTGRINDAGLDFYDRLIDELLAAGIQPWVTLFHWDFPQALFLRGGWLNPKSPDWFADYTRVLCDRLSDRVSHWITLNEPQCYIGLGHISGDHAPGLKLPMKEALLALHHTLLAHGRSAQVLREHAKTPPSIGLATVGSTRVPASDKPRDIEAARREMFAVREKTHLWVNSWFTDPLILGGYPEDGLKLFGKDAPRIVPSEMAVMRQPLDFFGVNTYSGQMVRAGRHGAETVKSPDGPPLTTMGWTVRPDCLYWGPRFFYERYKLPIVMTENGMANCDWVHLDGKVHDPQRIDYVSRHLAALGRAIRDGVKVNGYFYWSILDNFEWGHGYKQRFGLVHVDYASGKRTLKDSALWYRKVIATRGAIVGKPWPR